MSDAERGAGTVLALGVAGAAAAAALALAALVPPLVARQRAAETADAAALGAADVALGVLPGVPCERAAVVSSANGATLAACSQEGVVVQVRVLVAAPFGPVVGEARAGPPPADPPE